jgi:hypothetical protein
MAKTTAPSPKAPVEEHKKHAEDFLLKEEHKQPKAGQPTKSDTANP